MVRYLDTCILMSLFFHDPGTQAALAWIEEVGTEPLVITSWTRVEFGSAAGIMARRGDISADLQTQGLARCERFITARLAIETVTTTDFDRARSWVADYSSGLRAGDALHLASCMRLGASLCTADMTLAATADRFGIAVRRLA